MTAQYALVKPQGEVFYGKDAEDLLRQLYEWSIISRGQGVTLHVINFGLSIDADANPAERFLATAWYEED